MSDTVFSWESQAGEWCWACRINKHRDCYRHLNDGAHDAEDFIMVHGVLCPCPCGGEVGTAYPRMIELIGALRDQVEGDRRRIERLGEEKQELRAELNRAMDELVERNECEPEDA